MRTLYFDLYMGAAGDMLTAALSEILPDGAAFIEKLNAVGLPGVLYRAEKVKKCGVTGTKITVTVGGESEGEHCHGHEHGHEHSDLHRIEHIIEHAALSEKVKRDVLSVYRIIAEAESQVHGVPVGEVHFHEVGAMDAVADVTAVCMAVEELAPERIVSSPVNVGGGTIKCAHGVLPVPAPATALILKGVPSYSGDIKSELCTPTGAALIKYFTESFGSMPVMKAEKIGYGMGTKDFETANCVRAFWGETEGGKDRVTELNFNVDDMTAEQIAFATAMLWEAGAREVYTLPAYMKKNRPGTLISVICDAQARDKIIKAAFTHTSTIGVRETLLERCILERSVKEVNTPYGKARVKVSVGYGVEKAKPEYEDAAKIARENGITLEAAQKAILSAYEDDKNDRR